MLKCIFKCTEDEAHIEATQDNGNIVFAATYPSPCIPELVKAFNALGCMVTVNGQLCHKAEWKEDTK